VSKWISGIGSVYIADLGYKSVVIIQCIASKGKLTEVYQEIRTPKDLTVDIMCLGGVIGGVL
jgi:hypothetical protein